MVKNAEILKEERELNNLQEKLKNIEILVKKQRKKVVLLKLLQRLELEDLKNVDLP